MNTQVFLLLGANLGSVQDNLEQAILLISQQIGQVVARSSFYKTSPWGNSQQPDFLNVALIVNTQLSALEVLSISQSIEKQLGRVRHEHWGARTMDIDLLFFGNNLIDLPNLQVPHPLLAQRRFVLIPLAEIAPDFVHPVLQLSIQTLLEQCEDKEIVEKLED